MSSPEMRKYKNPLRSRPSSLESRSRSGTRNSCALAHCDDSNRARQLQERPFHALVARVRALERKLGDPMHNRLAAPLLGLADEQVVNALIGERKWRSSTMSTKSRG